MDLPPNNDCYTFDYPFTQFDAFSTPNHQIELNSNQNHDDVPQPLDSLHGNLVPPFLSKTFDLVDDSSLNMIICWGSTGKSFVVLDPVEFARILLPRNFKHSNFSSFVRQLNTYGFRKIDADRWEFANEFFQRGKKYLLKDIQRRKSPQLQHVVSFSGSSSSEVRKFGAENEIKKLRKEKTLLLQDVAELQNQHCQTVDHIKAVKQRIQESEESHKNTISFLAKLFQNPKFISKVNMKQKDIDFPSTFKNRSIFPKKKSDLAMEIAPLKIENDGLEEVEEAASGENPVFSPDMWNVDYRAKDISGTSNFCDDLWSNHVIYDKPEFELTSGFSDLLDLGSIHGAGSSGIQSWPSDESFFNQPDRQAGQWP